MACRPTDAQIWHVGLHLAGDEEVPQAQDGLGPRGRLAPRLRAQPPRDDRPHARHLPRAPRPPTLDPPRLT
eukprot:5089603-Prymnesium_polylepis.1